jgi:serine phosphatase RsbU (regulator of sigma subunit)
LQEKNKLIEQQSNKILDSINYAKRIQQAMLTDEETLKSFFKDAFVYYKPRDIVSGDFYWTERKDDKLIVATVDCTGHGVPGAFMSMIGYMLFNDIVNQRGITEPATIIKKLHEGVQKSLQQHIQPDPAQDGMDVALCVIDNSKRSLKFVGAPSSIFVVKEGELHEYKGDYQGVGGIFGNPGKSPRFSLTTHDISLDNNTSHIYMFSDGFMDQFGGDDYRKFGHQRFREILLKNYNKPFENQKSILDETMSQWRNDYRQTDDMLVLGLQV